MLNTVITAIARLLGLQTKQDKVTAEPTPIAGPVPQEPMQPAGKACSVETTKRQSSRVLTASKQKQERAPSTSAAAKPGKKKSTVQTVRTGNQSKATGSKSKTAASKTRPPVKQVAKAKR